MLDFQLFRIQVYLSPQTSFLDTTRDPRTILEQAIKARPSVDLSAGVKGHIGNVSQLDDTAYYFRFGKTRKTNIEVYKDGSFEDEEFEQAPYTHVVLDVEREVCCIARKATLSPKVFGIATQLARLLTRSETGTKFRATFGIGEINDPTDFIVFLQKAVAIEKLWMTFSPPNAWDANEDFEEPLRKTLRELDGKKGKVEFEGEHLKTEGLEDALRSTAAVGNDAGATLWAEGEERRVRKRLRGNSVIVSQEEIVLDEDRRDLLARMRRAYDRVRGNRSDS